MSTALRIQTLDGSSTPGSPIADVDFDRKEVTNVEIFPAVETVIKRSQKGNPTLFLRQAVGATPYHTIRVDFRIHGITTTNKLVTIRNHLLGGGTLRIYPKYYSDDSTFYDCFAEPKFLNDLIFSGEQKGGERETIIFHESDQTSQVTVGTGVVVVE